ncbi:MAG: TAXI family TRAP transporter solute-binding subunit [Treponema sp.]|jgi:TRAP transporter TAXI family solute receptor|nr:TAXI family TRAP transporter solute-binding subunit [Treponema sp.]
MKKLNHTVVILLLAVLALSGCTPKQAVSRTAEKPTEKYDIILGTAGTAGTYYVVGAAMAQAINNHSDRVNVIAQPTKGSIENINLTNTGDIQMGMSNADGVYWATTGTGTYANTGAMNVSAVMSLYMSAGQMVTLRSKNIVSYADLRGKKVCLGPPSTTIVEMSKAILRGYGIDPDNGITPFFLSFDEGLGKLTDGDIDATFFVAGIPTAAMINAASTGNIRFIEASNEVLEKVSTENPYFQRYSIPAGTYRGQDTDVPTLKIMTEIFVNNEVPEDVVYEFVKNALVYQPEYLSSHVVVVEITPQTAASTISKLHPGALKYYKEAGIR